MSKKNGKPSAAIYTIMQYEKHPETGEPLWSENHINAGLQYKTIKRWAYVCHDKDVYSAADEEANPERRQGDIKPKHWHLCIQCSQNIDIDVIARWFGVPENFVTIPRGSGYGKFADCVEYLTHEDEKQQELGKYRYPDEEVHANFDWRTEVDKRHAQRLRYGRDLDARQQMIYDVLYNGKTLYQCECEDKVLTMENYDMLKRRRLQYIARQPVPTSRLNYYVYGKGGVGKGLLCRALARAMYPQLKADNEIYFEVGGSGALFDGYDGQPVLIWNDRRAKELLKDLKGRENAYNVFDTHPSAQMYNVKFGIVNLINCVNIVNGPDDYVTFLDGLAGDENKGQSYRRFPMVIPVRADDFDVLLNKGYMYDDASLYFDYEQYSNIRCNMQQIARKLSGNDELRRQIEKQAVAVPLQAHEQFVQHETPQDVDEKIIAEFAEYGKSKP